MKHLIVYPNCSKGGVTSVIRGRAVANPSDEYHVVFFNDRGGRDAFDDLKNVTVRLPRNDRSAAFISHLVDTIEYSSVSVLSSPETVNTVNWMPELQPIYEFHSSDISVIRRELSHLKLGRICEFRAPSEYLAGIVRRELGTQISAPVVVLPNLVDSTAFWKGKSELAVLPYRKRPLVWIGRFDKGKGYRYFLRLLRTMPDEYIGVAIVSLESDPARAAEFWGEAYANGVQDRLHLLLNLPQRRVGSLYREAVSAGGALVSTSLMESFGYSIAEALACGLRIAAFELPPYDEHIDPEGLLSVVDIGDLHAMRSVLLYG